MRAAQSTTGKTIEVGLSAESELAGGFKALPPGQVITAVFRDFRRAGRFTVKVTPFQMAGGVFGVGVYVTGGDGEPLHGTVLRWDGGDPDSEPRVIRWQAPHCADDECGSPCRHSRKEASR